jgi:hypothetical protein
MIPAKGYLDEALNMDLLMNRLSDHIEKLPGRFTNFSKDELLQRPSPDKWSRQEILGHLIDSAINNLKRFTEIQFLPFPHKISVYQQVDLVKVNDYQDLPLEHLLSLWQALNRQIVFVAKNISPDKLEYPVDPDYPSKELKTLGWTIGDYVAHMEHHFRQIFQ